jgi:uncharacterized membrane-anchored protein
VVLIAGALVLVAVNVVVYQREALLASGRTVLLELAPVDPRSLMQGDYMALEWRVAREADAELSRHPDGQLVLRLDDRGVGTFVRRDDATPLGEREVRLRYRTRNGRVRLATDAWFFEEGRAGEYASARFGEFRVDESGEALLAAMRDEKLNRLGVAGR